MTGNSIIPTEAEHDDHHAHACIMCNKPFTRKRRPKRETPEGDICAECAEENDNEQKQN